LGEDFSAAASSGPSPPFKPRRKFADPVAETLAERRQPRAAEDDQDDQETGKSARENQGLASETITSGATAEAARLL
jgi:hypothetical protein